MSRLLKVTFIAATAAVVIGSPAFAGTYANEMGTGDVHPIMQQGATSWNYSAPTYVASSRRSGLHSYAMVGSRIGNSNDAALTGGGSRGYNENLNSW
jgi:hypothetical protein